MNELEQRLERRAKRFWVSLVVLFLGLQLAIGGVAIYLLTGDRAVAVVPNYHQAALNWDKTKIARSAAERKHWKLELLASDVADQRGMRVVELLVFDSNQIGVDQLMISGHVYHHALASDVQPIEFRSVGEGRYLAMSSMGRAGLWQVELAIEGADEPITTSETIEIARPFEAAKES